MTLRMDMVISMIFPYRRSAFAVATALTASLALAACGAPNGENTDSLDADTAPETVTSTRAPQDNSSTPSVSETDVPETRTAQTGGSDRSDDGEAGLTPLGEANTEMKTARPESPGKLMVSNVRLGKHDNFDRVVFDLEGEGTPGWFVDYADTPTQQGSGNAIEYDGEIALNVNVDGTTYPFELGEEIPNIGTVEGDGGVVTEVISSGTFEGRSQFVVGLKEKRSYSVQVLENPSRLVIDIS